MNAGEALIGTYKVKYKTSLEYVPVSVRDDICSCSVLVSACGTKILKKQFLI